MYTQTAATRVFWLEYGLFCPPCQYLSSLFLLLVNIFIILFKNSGE